MASVNTFKGCLDTIDVSRPDWIALENVEAIDREGPDDSSFLDFWNKRVRCEWCISGAATLH